MLSVFVKTMVAALEAAGINYFITGSIASIAYGEPRLTLDVDIVADLDEESVCRLKKHFPEDDYYFSLDAAKTAIRNRTQFNIISLSTGLKADLMIPPDTAFNRSRFLRRREIVIPDGCNARAASPEDVILKKLEYFQMGGSDKHLRDIAGMIKTSGSSLDFEYLRDWASRLELGRLWDLVLSRQQRS